MLDLPTPILVGTLFPGLSLTATFCGAITASGESATTTKSCSGSWATFEAAASAVGWPLTPQLPEKLGSGEVFGKRPPRESRQALSRRPPKTS